MNRRFVFDDLEDHPLLRGTVSLQACNRLTTAVLVARIGEIDSRRLCERIGYPSTMAWCIVELQLSEDEASRRIRAARFGRKYPELFEALADGRLHLTAVNLIGPHLTKDTVEEWIAAATHRTRAEIQSLIAIRRPRPDCPDGIVELADYVLDQVSDRVLPTAPQRHLFQCAVGEQLRVMFEEARCLMSHQNPSGNYEAVLIEAFELLIPELKKRKFATSGSGNRRISSEVKEKVWVRDGGRCVYEGENGRRCGSTWQVEFDHIDLVAWGGGATEDKIRCLCRPHNQLEAERQLGVEFMEQKRREAIEARRASRIEARNGTRAGAGWPSAESSCGTGAGADRSPVDQGVTGAGAGERPADPLHGTLAAARPSVSSLDQECPAASAA